jgi:hypothetical protein
MMTVMDDRLKQCNESELIEMARKQGIGRLRRGLPHEVLEQLVRGEYLPRTEHLAGTSQTRHRLQKIIWDNYSQTRSQLPGCTGKCTEYPCSEGRHAGCFGGVEDTVR